MTIREKEFFKAQVKYELKLAKVKVRNLEFILDLLTDKETKETLKNETRKARNKDKYLL